MRWNQKPVTIIVIIYNNVYKMYYLHAHKPCTNYGHAILRYHKTCGTESSGNRPLQLKQSPSAGEEKRKKKLHVRTAGTGQAFPENRKLVTRRRNRRDGRENTDRDALGANETRFPREKHVYSAKR